MFKRRTLGERGERYAASWLRRRGYRIVGRNVRFRRDEADLIALAPDGRTTVVVEVKTRRNAEPAPELKIDAAKRRALERIAMHIANRTGDDRPVRIDVVTIVWPADATPVVRHVEAIGE